MRHFNPYTKNLKSNFLTSNYLEIDPKYITHISDIEITYKGKKHESG